MYSKSSTGAAGMRLVPWNGAIERVERGEVGAIVVWNLDRFSRSLIDALDALDRIEKVVCTRKRARRGSSNGASFSPFPSTTGTRYGTLVP